MLNEMHVELDIAQQTSCFVRHGGRHLRGTGCILVWWTLWSAPCDCRAADAAAHALLSFNALMSRKSTGDHRRGKWASQNYAGLTLNRAVIKQGPLPLRSSQSEDLGESA